MKKLCAILLVISALAGCKSSAPATQQTTAISTVAAKPQEVVNLPVFIPVTELQSQLYQLLFAPNQGKYYPCNGNDCGDAYKDLYIENPQVHIQQGLITIQMHLAGTAHVLFSFDVSGDVMLSATPEVRNDTLYFKNITLQPVSQSLLLSITSSLFGRKIINKIQEHAWYSFQSQLDSMTAAAKKNFPMKWGNMYLLLDLNKIYLDKVEAQQKPMEGIIADFAAEMNIETSDFINLPQNR